MGYSRSWLVKTSRSTSDNLASPYYNQHWPAELRGVRPRNLEQSTSFATHSRTVAEHLQAPAEDSAFPAPVIHCPALLWLISEFGAVYKYSDSTQHSILPAALVYAPDRLVSRACAMATEAAMMMTMMTIIIWQYWMMSWEITQSHKSQNDY